MVINIINLYSVTGNDRINLLETTVFENLKNEKLDNKISSEIIEIVRFYLLNNPNNAIKFINKVLRYEVVMKDSKLTADCFTFMGNCYKTLGLDNLAAKYIFQGLKIYYQINDITSASWNLLEVGNLYYQVKQYDKALDYYIKSIEGFNNLNEPLGLGVAYDNLGLCYYNLSNFDSASINFLLSVKYREISGNHSGLQLVYLHLSRLFLKKNDMINSEKYIRKSMEFSNPEDFSISKELSSIDLKAQSILELAKLFNRKKMFDSSWYYFNLGTKILHDNKIFITLINTYIDAANYFINQNDLNKSVVFAEKAKNLADSYNFTSEQITVNNLLSIIYKRQKDFKKSLYHLNLSRNYKDSLELISKSSDIVLADQNINIDDFFEKIQSLELENKVKHEKLKSQNYLLTGLSVFGVFIFVIFSIILYQNWFKKRTNRLLDEHNKQLSEINYKLERSEISLLNKNDELLKFNILLQESNEINDKLFSILAHDLRNSIGAVKNLSEVLSDSYDIFDDDERIDFINLMNLSSQRLKLLLENLLDWSGTLQGTLKPAFEKKNISDLVINNISVFQETAKMKSIEIINNIPENTYAFFDVYMIDTVLRNLINNAVKFTKNNGKILINAEKKFHALIISIKDNGIGMSEETQKQLFNFSKLKTTKGTNGEEGTGLGLMICKEFISNHGGELWFESKLNIGTTFYFPLPTHVVTNTSE